MDVIHHTLKDNFKSFFTIVAVTNSHLLNISKGIRHKVYCEELAWEDTNSEKIEEDGYDQYAFHFLILHKPTGEYAGSIRLAMPHGDGTYHELPFEKNCMSSHISGKTDPRHMERGDFGEISRLAVLSDFRRRRNETSVPFIIDKPRDKERHSFPYIAVGLYMAVAACAELNGHKGMFMVMEPKLRRQLRMFGLVYEQIGEVMDYHGRRAVHYLSCEDVANYSIKPELLEFYNEVKSQVNRNQLTINAKFVSYG
jgi:N-acyl amino acid synthase of PEP-CTERM/exosortase system